MSFVILNRSHQLRKQGFIHPSSKDHDAKRSVESCAAMAQVLADMLPPPATRLSAVPPKHNNNNNTQRKLPSPTAPSRPPPRRRRRPPVQLPLSCREAAEAPLEEPYDFKLESRICTKLPFRLATLEQEMKKVQPPRIQLTPPPPPVTASQVAVDDGSSVSSLSTYQTAAQDTVLTSSLTTDNTHVTSSLVSTTVSVASTNSSTTTTVTSHQPAKAIPLSELRSSKRGIKKLGKLFKRR